MKKICLSIFLLSSMLYSCGGGSNYDHLATDADIEKSVNTNMIYLSYFNPEPDSLTIEIGDSVFHAVPFEEVYTRSLSYDMDKPLMCRVKNGSIIRYETELDPGNFSDYFLNLGHRYYVEHRFYGENDTTLIYNNKIDHSKPVLKHTIEVPFSSYFVQTYTYSYVVIDTNEFLITPYWKKGLSDHLASLEYITKEDIPDGYLRKLHWSGDFEKKTYADAACPGNFYLIKDMIDFCNIMSSYSTGELEIISSLSDSSDMFVKDYLKHKDHFQSVQSLKKGHSSSFKALGKFDMYLSWQATVALINSNEKIMMPACHIEKITRLLESVYKHFNKTPLI